MLQDSLLGLLAQASVIVFAATGLSVSLIGCLYWEYVQPYVFFFHGRFKKIIDSYKLGEQPNRVWKESEIKQRDVQARELMALSVKSLGNILLLISFSWMFLVAMLVWRHL